jgi:hypothetical protein
MQADASLVAPGVTPYVSTMQSVHGRIELSGTHAAAPSHFPAEQSTQSSSEVLFCWESLPAGQQTHVVAPTLAEYLPREQESQPDDPVKLS